MANLNATLTNWVEIGAKLNMLISGDLYKSRKKKTNEAARGQKAGNKRTNAF